MPYTEYVDERIIGPLGLARTTWRPQEPKAQGYLVDEYARTVWLEPETDLGGAAAAGQLWSTVEDLGELGDVPRAGRDGVLDAKTVEEMWFPQVMYYPDELGARLGPRPRCSTTRRRRSTAATAVRWPATSPASSWTGRRRSAPPA